MNIKWVMALRGGMGKRSGHFTMIVKSWRRQIRRIWANLAVCLLLAVNYLKTDAAERIGAFFIQHTARIGHLVARWRHTLLHTRFEITLFARAVVRRPGADSTRRCRREIAYDPGKTRNRSTDWSTTGQYLNLRRPEKGGSTLRRGGRSPWTLSRGGGGSGGGGTLAGRPDGHGG